MEENVKIEYFVLVIYILYFFDVILILFYRENWDLDFKMVDEWFMKDLIDFCELWFLLYGRYVYCFGKVEVFYFGDILWRIWI